MPGAGQPQGFESDIRELAKAFAVSAADVHHILWGQIRRLKTTARILDFVPQLAIKDVKEYLHNRSSREPYQIHVSPEIGSVVAVRECIQDFTPVLAEAMRRTGPW